MRKNSKKVSRKECVTSPEPIVASVQEDLFRLAVMLLNEAPKENFQCPVYLFSETRDNEAALFQAAVTLGRLGNVSQYWLVNEVPRTNCGYPGGSDWCSKLCRKGASGLVAIRFIECREPLNTFSESLALVRHAKKEGWDKFIFTAPSFHLTRAALSIMGAMKRLGVGNLRAYAMPAAPLPWFETAAHSQGTLIRTRADLVIEEIRRIRKYHEKGDLVSPREALAYLKWRDSWPGSRRKRDFVWA